MLTRALLAATLLAPVACAHGEREALAVLAVSVDETAMLYAEAKRVRLAYCERTAQTMLEARECMGPYYDDRGTQLLTQIVAAQQAMAAAVTALGELREMIEDK